MSEQNNAQAAAQATQASVLTMNSQASDKAQLENTAKMLEEYAHTPAPQEAAEIVSQKTRVSIISIIGMPVALPVKSLSIFLSRSKHLSLFCL